MTRDDRAALEGAFRVLQLVALTPIPDALAPDDAYDTRRIYLADVRRARGALPVLERVIRESP